MASYGTVEPAEPPGGDDAEGSGASAQESRAEEGVEREEAGLVRVRDDDEHAEAPQGPGEGQATLTVRGLVQLLLGPGPHARDTFVRVAVALWPEGSRRFDIRSVGYDHERGCVLLWTDRWEGP